MTAITRASAKQYFEDEIWKPIPSFPNYEASSFGNIRNSRNNRLVKPMVHPARGHLIVYVGGGRNSRKHLLHRLVLMAFIGIPKKGQIGCHRNDIKTDNRLENLYWGTYKENTADQIRNGKFYFAKGEGNGQTKTSDEIVKKILLEYTGKRGEQSKLARKYGMSISNVHLIVHGRSRLDCRN